MDWKVVDRPGYFGTSREEICAKYDIQFGKDNWRIAWQWGDQIIERLEALQVYQRGYTKFLESDREILNWLVEYEDVFDTAPSNVKAGLSYDIQETTNNHIHDVAIRRSVILDFGLKFKGVKGLLHVRPGKEGEILGPHLIPFHMPNMIYRGPIKYKGEDRDFSINPPWWIKMGTENSIEQFYQQNKVLEVRL